MANPTLCLLTGEEVPPVKDDNCVPIIVTQGGKTIGVVSGAALLDIKVLKIILGRDASGNFTGVQAQCVEAMLDDYVAPHETDGVYR